MNVKNVLLPRTFACAILTDLNKLYQEIINVIEKQLQIIISVSFIPEYISYTYICILFLN